MRTDKINYACDDCKTARAVFRSDEKARKAGWAVARDNVTCWCPSCAPEHRFGKAAEKNDDLTAFSSGFQQLKFENL